MNEFVDPLLAPKYGACRLTCSSQTGKLSLGTATLPLLSSTRSPHSRLLPAFEALVPTIPWGHASRTTTLLTCTFWSWIVRDAWKSVEEQTRERRYAASLLLKLR